MSEPFDSGRRQLAKKIMDGIAAARKYDFCDDAFMANFLSGYLGSYVNQAAAHEVAAREAEIITFIAGSSE